MSAGHRARRPDLSATSSRLLLARSRSAARRPAGTPTSQLESWGTAMSKNSELILAGYEAWNRDDLDAYLETLHPEVKLHTSGVWPDFDPVYSGHEGITEFWRRMHEPWEGFRMDIEHINEEGDRFTTAVRFRARGVDSGVEVDMPFAHGLR